MQKTRVKICGITSVAAAESAVESGADAIGLVFYGKSPRAIKPEIARDIARSVGPFVTVVGLFVNAERADIGKTAMSVGLDLIQLHGNETPEFCQGLGMPYIRALRMSPGMDVVGECGKYPNARGILLDAWNPEKYGGTGETFDWNRVPHSICKPLVLAGGLTPENVAQAVAEVKPYAVDVSGGVESAPGVKSDELMKEFIANAKFGEKH
ncbi:MAG: phosphoribosylanthranilate isomerase [bacterium]